MKYFAKIKYLGTAFHGFQVQPDCRTVMSELSCALEQALGAPSRITGCSRTDAGVHANEFCLTVECPTATVPPDKLPVAVARYMPADLSLFYAEACSDEFHPRYDVVSKEYLYRIVTSPIFDPFLFGRVFFTPRKLDDAAIERMRSAASHFVGKHDFSAFMSEGSDVVDTVRDVKYLEIDRFENEIDIRICADGFLYNMVRIIVGTLLDCAYGRTSPADIPDIIRSKDRSRAGMTAPAEGLYLNKVSY